MHQASLGSAELRWRMRRLRARGLARAVVVVITIIAGSAAVCSCASPSHIDALEAAMHREIAAINNG